jgi:hypothetical protein
MARTTYYSLYLTDDDQERFLDWREKMSGQSGSNMVMIDSLLKGKADSSLYFDTVLTAADWTGDTAPYTQVLQIPTMETELPNGMIGLARNATMEQRNAARAAMLAVAGQTASTTNEANNTLTIAADGSVPDVDIPVTVVFVN